jgi:rubrerythrin
LDKINNDPQEPTPPTGQIDLQGRDPAEFVEEHVKDNYRGLNDSGRSYEALADEAQRMGDQVLTAWLRNQSDSESYHEFQRGERSRVAAERGEQTKDPKAAPTNRSTKGGQQQNG